MSARKVTLDYIEGLLNQVTGVQGVYRNRGELPPQDKTPGIILLDGTVDRVTQVDGFNFSAQPEAAVYVIKPEIVLALTMRTDSDNKLMPDGSTYLVADEIALYENKILAAILTDENLAAMLGENGGIIYNGFDSDMRNGSTIGSTGAVTIFRFEFSYVLDLQDIREATA